MTVYENGHALCGTPITLLGIRDVLQVRDGGGKVFVQLELDGDRLAVFVASEGEGAPPRRGLFRRLGIRP